MRKVAVAVALFGGVLFGLPQQSSALAQCNHNIHSHWHAAHNHNHRWSTTAHKNVAGWHVNSGYEWTHGDYDEAWCYPGTGV